MSSSSIVNGVHRFSIRGKVQNFQSDRETNFVVANNPLALDVINCKDGPVRAYLQENNTPWVFNPPHASHIGGTWKGMIGITCKILDSNWDRMFRKPQRRTFMPEICAILNTRLIISISTDPQAQHFSHLRILCCWHRKWGRHLKLSRSLKLKKCTGLSGNKSKY